MSDSSRSGFLSRWSQRKIQARESRNPDEGEATRRAVTPDEARQASVELQPSPGKQTTDVPAATGTDPLSAALPDVAPAATPQKRDVALPNLEDVKLLTPDSDFSAFVARGVAPAVKNAAMKKLFADPHFNVMDGLDIYIDDYTQREVMPESMVRKMASSKFLEMFADEDDKKVQASGAGIDAAIPDPDDDVARPLASEAGDVSSLGVFPGLPTTFAQVQNQPKATRTSVIESEEQPGDAPSDVNPLERSN